MSTNSNTPNNSEEVDLGQLFKLIGNTFDRLFNFISSIFKNIFLAFVWAILLIKKRIIILALATISGVLIGVYSNKTTKPKYESSATLVLNYPTGEYLYKSISYYNDLIRQGNYKTLGTVLSLEEERAESILALYIEPAVSKNGKLLAFNEYTKSLDSLARAEIKYKDFLEQSENFSYNHQQIRLISTDVNNFKSVFENIVEDINTNTYFLNEQRKDIAELNETKIAIELSLQASESLQETYKKVLEQGFDSGQTSEIGITFEGSSKTEKTREYDLYQSDIKLRRELVGTERGLLERQYIIEIILNKQEIGILSNTKKLFGKEFDPILFFGIQMLLLVLIILFGLEFLKYIVNLKNKVNI
ncbi:hypothetical protein OAC97_00080 [Flavobacteriaceae bacterium]|nr:hypothetical protein [Flavobacteriaceae bacterium]